MNIKNFVDSYNELMQECKKMLLENIHLFSENEKLEEIEFVTLSDSEDSISVMARIRVNGIKEDGSAQVGSVGLNYFIPLYAFDSEEDKKKWIKKTAECMDVMKGLSDIKDIPEWLKSLES